MNNTLYSYIWRFIEEYLPNYSSRDDVLQSDILFRYIEGEEVYEDDLEWIRNEFGSNTNAIEKECIRLEKQFLTEALDCFYEQYLKYKCYYSHF